MPARWSSEIEAVVQRGESGGTVGGNARPNFDHRAYFVHLEIGYTVDRPWQPTIMLQYDRASGDRDPADARVERFHTLLGARRFDFGPTGHLRHSESEQRGLAGRAPHAATHFPCTPQ